MIPCLLSASADLWRSTSAASILRKVASDNFTCLEELHSTGYHFDSARDCLGYGNTYGM